MLFITIIGGVLILFIYITRLASNEIFSPSNKIHREVGRAKDLSAPRTKQFKSMSMKTVNLHVFQLLGGNYPEDFPYQGIYTGV
jgi:hypothetical protein